MKLSLALLLTLVLAPLARADSIVYATDEVQVPVHVVQVGVDGHGTKVISTARALDVGADGSVASASGDSLRVDGRVIATVKWQVDDARFSGNGRQIAFTADSLVKCGPAATNCATWELWLVNRDGSGLRELSTDGRYPRFSPSGRELAFLGGFSPECDCGTVVVQDLVTGHRTWFELSSSPPDFAPDGRHLAYSSQRYVRIATWAPRHARTLTRGAEPVFSTDGRLVAYLGQKGLMTQPVSGGKAQIAGEHSTGGYAWTSTGWLVYGSWVSNYPGNSEVLRVRADGSRRAVVRKSEPITYVDWLRVYGTRVVVETVRTRWSASTIDSVDLRTGVVTLLTHDLGDDRSPSFSSGGTIAYAKGSSTRFGWYCLSVAAVCVTTATTVDGIQDPAWSPDGRTIAVVSRRDLLLVDPVTRATRVLHTFTGNASSPTWSPDGRTLAVSSPAPDGHIHLWLVDAATGATTQLATGDVGFVPSWSPDGAEIAFVGGTWGGPYELDLYTVATGTYAPLLPVGPQPVASRPAWSPDSARIAYQAGDESVHVVSRSGVADKRVVAHAVQGSALAWR